MEPIILCPNNGALSTYFLVEAISISICCLLVYISFCKNDNYSIN